MNRLDHYTRDYFSAMSIETSPNLQDHVLRADQLSALGYAHGIDFNEAGALDAPGAAPLPSPLERQLDIVRQGARRHPAGVLSVGAGRGELELSFARLDEPTWMVEPAGAALQLAQENRPWFCPGPEFANLRAVQSTLGQLPGLAVFPALWDAVDTVLLVEAIEHIPLEETRALVELLRRTNRPRRLIIANWTWFHPIEPDGGGWNHITRIDDRLYDEISGGGQQAMRHGSHLVVDFGGPP